MLVLTRRPGEKIVIPGLGITVQVVRCQDGKVRLGFDAPKHIQFLRSELLDRPRPEDTER